MADIGFIALLIALASSICSVLAFVFGAAKGYSKLASNARIGVLAACLFISLASYVLYYALLTHDFQLEYVASHTSRDMPLIYNISAFWAGNAGALLLMSWLLSLAAIVVVSKWKKDVNLVAYASAVIMGTLAFLLLLMVLAANPFETLSNTPSDGRGINPALEHLGMIIHPPLLLAGFIAFTVPFALAIATLATGNRGSGWLSGTRTWALLAWLLLGAGNLVGAWWAYVEMGWGGYWAWDPVENAGLMPWLLGTAFLHTISVQRKTGTLRVWTMTLIILTFNLCMFGMFLNRSDFLPSVHNYSNTGMETMFLIFLAIISLGPLLLMISKRNYFKDGSRKGNLVSRENSFILANILFTAVTFVILLGTLLPWLSETITGKTTTVEASFFNKTAAPLFLIIILLAGICILLGWRRALLRKLFRRSIVPLAISSILCLVLYIVDIREWYALTLFPLCAFTVFAHLSDLYRRVRTGSRTGRQNPLKAIFRLLLNNRPYYGGMIVHLGIALIAIGIIGSSFYKSETEVSLLEKDSAKIENYTLTYEGMSVKNASDKIIYTASLSVDNGSSSSGKLEPQAIIDLRTMHPLKEVAIGSMPHWWFPQEDLYIVLKEWDKDGTATFQVTINPLVSLIWIGGGGVLLGGLFAFWPAGTGENNNLNGRRRKQTPDSTPTAETGTDHPL